MAWLCSFYFFWLLKAEPKGGEAVVATLCLQPAVWRLWCPWSLHVGVSLHQSNPVLPTLRPDEGTCFSIASSSASALGGGGAGMNTWN